MGEMELMGLMGMVGMEGLVGDKASLVVPQTLSLQPLMPLVTRTLALLTNATFLQQHLLC